MSTVADLMQHFQDKIDLVKGCLILRDAFQGEENGCVEMFTKLTTSVHNLELALLALKNEIKQQRNALEKVQTIKENMELFKERVQYGLENIPPHVPQLHHTSSRVIEAPAAPSRPPPTVTPVTLPVTMVTPHFKELYRPPTQKPKGPALEYLTVDEFESVPKYMKGRLTYAQMNTAIASFNQSVAAKHKVLSTPRNKQNLPLKNLIVEYKEQETKATDGYFFIMDADLQTHSNFKLDKAGRSCLTILRHCGRIKEARTGKITRYLVNNIY